MKVLNSNDIQQVAGGYKVAVTLEVPNTEATGFTTLMAGVIDGTIVGSTAFFQAAAASGVDFNAVLIQDINFSGLN